jgi:hypothetical protein
MITAGKNVGDLSTVELFNWRTGQQCPLKDIPIKVRIHAGTVFRGIPMICGGFSSEVSIANCYNYSIQDKIWLPVSIMPIVINNRRINLFEIDGW